MPFLRSQPELLIAFRRGDRDALEKVYWAYVGRVEQLVLRRALRGRSRRASDVADLVQEVFIRAFSERGRLGYDGLREYGPYLLTIARNVTINRARAEGREPALADSDVEMLEPAAEAHAEEDPPWADPATMAVVEAFLASLPQPMRDLHHQRYVLGLPQREAATALSITRQQLRTVEDKLRRGLEQALRKASLLD